MKFVKFRTCVFLAGLVFAFAAVGSANEPMEPTGTAMQLDKIVITGSRVETRLKETPATIDVITDQQVEKTKYRNAGELLRTVPGVFTQNLNGEEELTSIRIPTHFSNPYSLLLIDGLPATSYGDGAGGLFREINNAGVERIEVIKGPASALYGSNAIGGVINVITKGPSPDPRVKPWVEYGDYDQWRGGLSGGGMAGALGISADLMFIDAAEWREHSSHRKQSGTVRAQFSPTDTSLIDLKVEAIHLDNDTAGTLDAEDYEENWQQSYMTFTGVTLDKITPSLTYSADVMGGELKASGQYRSVDHEVNPNYGIRYNGRLRQYTSYLSRIDVADLDLQLQYSRPLNFWNSRWVAGVDFEDGNSDLDTYDLTVTRDSATGKYTDYEITGLGKSYSVDTRVAAPYLQMTAIPVNRLQLTLGGRYDTVNYDIEDNLAASGNDTSDFSRFSPKVGITYDVNDRCNLFASYAHGFVVPTVSQLFTGRGSNKDLEPEKAENYEAGFRSVFWDNRLALNVSLYYMEVEDKIIVQTIDPITSAIEYQNVGETSHKGMETTLAFQPSKFIRLDLAYTLSNSTYEEFDDPVTGIDYSGNRMPLAPDNRLNLRLAVFPVKGMSAELEADIQDEYFMDDANTGEYDQPALIHFRGSYDWRNWSFWAHVTNLTDEKYATRVTGTPENGSYFPGNPRTFFAGLSYLWGKR